MDTQPVTPALSIVHGSSLEGEVGIGAQTIPGYLREVVDRFGAREALVMHTSGGVVRWSYAQLWERSVEVARALRAVGVGKDSRVGVLMTNRPEYLAAAFGIAMAGGVIVTLSTFSTPNELEQLLHASGVSVLLLERFVAKKDFAALLLELEPQIGHASPGALMSSRFPFLRSLAVVGDGDDAAAVGAIESWPVFLRRADATPLALIEASARSVMPADIGALFFSSGSTGTPKGILHSQRAVALQWWRWPRFLALDKDVRAWTANGFFWSGNFSMQIGSAFTTGGALVLQSTFVPEEALQLLEVEKVTLPVASPHQMERMTEAANYATADLSSLRYIDDRRSLARHPSVRSDWRLPPAFGTTETFAINCSFPASTPLGTRGGHGEPLPGNTLKIFDPDTGEILPRGQRGEIGIKGPTLMLGYIGKTADEVFDADGYYHTGDGGYVDDSGWLYWEGRLSDIIKTGGANVSPIEIDIAIRTHTGVKVTQTVGVPHETLGEIVVACIVPHEGVVLDEAGVRDFLKQRLASYKVPRRVLFLREDELAMTGSNKVKAGELRRLAAQKLGAAG